MADLARPDRVYAAAFRLGLFRSDDSGSTWTDRNSGPDIFAETRDVIRLLQSRDAAAVYAVTPVGVLQTVDGGESWIHALPLHTSESTRMADVALDPSSPGTVYQVALECVVVECIQAFVHKTVDGGASWTQIGSLPPEDPRLFPSLEPHRLFAIGGSVLYRTDDAGVLAEVPGAPRLSTLAGDPSDPTLLYGASDRLYRSSDGGNTWSPVEDSGFPRSQATALVVDAGRPSTIFLGTASRGVWISEDSGASWIALNEDLDVLSIESLSLSADGRTLYAGTEYAVFQYTFCDSCPMRPGPGRPLPRSVPSRRPSAP